MSKRRRITLLGKRYELRFVSRLGKSNPHEVVVGTCDHPEDRGKAIRIRRGQSDLDELDTVLHECLHAVDWHKDEEWTARVANDLAKVLWRLGWRKNPNS